LKTIERLSKEAPKENFEVTQLVNSAIGLLMFPQQEFFEMIPMTDLAALKKQGWPIPKFEFGEERTRNLRDLTKNMRNSFAHFNIDFKPEKGKIVGLYLWNRPEEKQPPNWVCYISIEDFRLLFEKFVAIVHKISSAPYAESGIKQVRSEFRRANSQMSTRT